MTLANSPSAMCESPTASDSDKSELDKSSNNFQNGRRQKNYDPARDISIQVLEKFSLVTRFARETTSQLFRETQLDLTPNEGWRDDPLSPASNHTTASHDSPKVPVAADPVEVIIYLFTSCLLLKTRFRWPIFCLPVIFWRWASFICSMGCRDYILSFFYLLFFCW